MGSPRSNANTGELAKQYPDQPARRTVIKRNCTGIRNKHSQPTLTQRNRAKLRKNAETARTVRRAPTTSGTVSATHCIFLFYCRFPLTELRTQLRKPSSVTVGLLGAVLSAPTPKGVEYRRPWIRHPAGNSNPHPCQYMCTMQRHYKKVIWVFAISAISLLSNTTTLLIASHSDSIPRDLATYRSQPSGSSHHRKRLLPLSERGF